MAPINEQSLSKSYKQMQAGMAVEIIERSVTVDQRRLQSEPFDLASNAFFIIIIIIFKVDI